MKHDNLGSSRGRAKSFDNPLDAICGAPKTSLSCELQRRNSTFLKTRTAQLHFPKNPARPKTPLQPKVPSRYCSVHRCCNSVPTHHASRTTIYYHDTTPPAAMDASVTYVTYNRELQELVDPLEQLTEPMRRFAVGNREICLRRGTQSSRACDFRELPSLSYAAFRVLIGTCTPFHCAAVFGRSFTIRRTV